MPAIPEYPDDLDMLRKLEVSLVEVIDQNARQLDKIRQRIKELKIAACDLKPGVPLLVTPEVATIVRGRFGKMEGWNTYAVARLLDVREEDADIAAINLFECPLPLHLVIRMRQLFLEHFPNGR